MIDQRPRSTGRETAILRIAPAVACLLTLGLLAGACSRPTVQEAGQPVAPYPGAASATTVPVPVVPMPPAEAYPGGPTPDRAAALAELAGARSVEIVEDWAGFASIDAVEAAISRNQGVGDNKMDLSLDGSEGGVLPPGQVLAMAYDIVETDPDDFVGFSRDLEVPADWTGATAIGLWAQWGGGSDVDVVLQFREASGEVWRSESPLPAPRPGGARPRSPSFLLPLAAETFQRAEWSTTDNERIDLGAIDQYGLYVGHQGPGKAGSVRFGPIVLVR